IPAAAGRSKLLSRRGNCRRGRCWLSFIFHQMSSPQRRREHGDRAEKSLLISVLPRRPPRLCGEDYGKQIRIDPFHETGSSAMRALGVLLVTILFAFLAAISGGTQNPNQLLTERAYQDREILYELQTPESHAFRITHYYTVR